MTPNLWVKLLNSASAAAPVSLYAYPEPHIRCSFHEWAPPPAILWRAKASPGQLIALHHIPEGEYRVDVVPQEVYEISFEMEWT